MSTRERNLATSVATSSAKLSTLRTAPLRAQVCLLSMKPINKCDCHECCLVLAPNTHIEVFTSYAVDRSMIKRRCEPAKPLQWRPSVNNIMNPAHLLVNARRLPRPCPARDRVGVWPIVRAPVSRFRSSTPPLAQAMRSPQRLVHVLHTQLRPWLELAPLALELSSLPLSHLAKRGRTAMGAFQRSCGTHLRRRLQNLIGILRPH